MATPHQGTFLELIMTGEDVRKVMRVHPQGYAILTTIATVRSPPLRRSSTMSAHLKVLLRLQRSQHSLPSGFLVHTVRMPVAYATLTSSFWVNTIISLEAF